MKKLINGIIVVVFFITGCRSSKTDHGSVYHTIDYTKVGKMLPAVKAPYVIDLKTGSKRLVFIGCDHSNDFNDSQFAVISQYFITSNPRIAFNEGGQFPDSLHFQTPEEAVSQKGESGFLKYLCDSSGISMINGDISDSLEFSITLKKYPKEDLFLYYIMERLVIPYLDKAYGNRPFEELYNLAIDRWFVKQGFPLTKKEQSLDYFKQLYREKMGRPFVLEINKDNFEKFDYINGDCKYCEIGRTSKMVRDSVLLQKIKMALSKKDRVFVTFGLGHALAIEPALKDIMKSSR